MKKKDYKQAIIEAHYHPSAELVEAVMVDHDKLLDTKLVDGAFKRLYRPSPSDGSKTGSKPAGV